MKKHLIINTLWLIGILGTLSIWVVNAIDITITYNLSGWYWVEDGSTWSKQIQFQTDWIGMIPTTDWKTPSRKDECEENGEMKKCMFDWWYLENWARWTWYSESDITVYAKWLPFENLTITSWSVSFTIMDRNLWAITGWTGCSNANPCGYHFQWWNNYGFKPNTWWTQDFPNKEYFTWARSTDWKSHVSTYYNAKWIDSGPWNEWYQWDDNLWWWSKSSNSDEDKQWPCPYWYHVPDTLEWKAVWRALNVKQNWDVVRDILNLPYAGLRTTGTHYVGRLGTEWRYWSSTPNWENADFLYFAKTYVYRQYDSTRVISRAVRCFENAPIKLLTFNYNGWNTTYLNQPNQTVRWRETPIELSTETDTTREFSTFEWWYTDLLDETTKVITNNITWEDDTIILYAKWSCDSWYVENASGTGCLKWYTVIYELNDGVISWENVTWYTIESDDITLINPTKTWYTFIWRSGTELNSPTMTVTIPRWSTWDRNYEANWTEDKKPSWSSSGWGGRSNKTSDTQDSTTQNDKNTENIIQSETKLAQLSWVKSEESSNIPIDSSDRSSEWQTYTQEFQEAYEFAKWKWITTMPTIQKANMEWKLTRIAMAKMLSQYAMNVLWQKPANIVTPKFNDVSDKQNSDYDDWVTLAYQLWIMWLNMPWNNFRPNDEVTRAEFATALSRMAYWTSDGEYKWTWKYYIHHMEKLVKEWIITKDDPNMKELRWYVMIMLMRSSEK